MFDEYCGRNLSTKTREERDSDEIWCNQHDQVDLHETVIDEFNDL